MIHRNKILSHLLISIIIVIVVIVFLWFVLRLFNVTFDAKGGETIVLAFFGILATFVVVGNYSQVSSIKSEVQRQLDQIDDIVDNHLEEEKQKITQSYKADQKARAESLSDAIIARWQSEMPETLRRSVATNNAELVRGILTLHQNNGLDFLLYLFEKPRKSYTVTFKDSSKKSKIGARINDDNKVEFFYWNKKDGNIVSKEIISIDTIGDFNQSMINSVLQTIYNPSISKQQVDQTIAKPRKTII